MSKPKEIPQGYVQKQTLFGAAVLCLLIGFIGGTIYSSLKLGRNAAVVKKEQSRAAGEGRVESDPSEAVASAVMNLDTYLKAHPDDAQAWVKLGNIFFDSNQVVSAISAYEKALKLDPDQVSVITDLGVMYRRNKQPQKAVQAFDKAISLAPEFEIARFNKGIVLLHDLNDQEGAISAWEKLLEINPMAMAPGGESIDAMLQRMKQPQK